MERQASRNDYEWVTTDEPHRTRRKEILDDIFEACSNCCLVLQPICLYGNAIADVLAGAKYPEVKKLMVPDPRLKYSVLLLVVVQTLSAYVMRDVSWMTLLLVSYFWGGVINHAMTLAIHEIAHNLAFGHQHPQRNRALGIFGNLILGIPYSVIFKTYHLEHHKYQGLDGVDTDIPSSLEAALFNSAPTKLLWMILQPFFYALRPVITRPNPITTTQVINLAAQVTFNYLIWMTMGWTSLLYLILGTFLALGLHPVAGHFISEHYMFKVGFETYSYYGLLNRLTFNVGYHNEHHDFPNIPGSLLPQLRKIAPEYYDNLPYHRSWVCVIWDFITDPAIGPYARIKRKATIGSSDFRSE